MSDIDFDHDAVASYPRPLHSVATGLAAASTLPSPDVGASTTLTRTAVTEISTQCAALGAAFDDLCGAVLFCLRLYPEADGGVASFLELQAKEALS